MKIREKMLLGNLVLGILPVLLTIVIVTMAVSYQYNKEIKSNISSTLNEIKSKIDSMMENYRNYAYFFSRSVQVPEYEAMKYLTSYSGSINIFTYGLKMLEFSYSNEIVRKDFDLPENAIYLTGQEQLNFMWKVMNNPANNPEFKMSFPDEVSNTLIVRNVAIVKNPANNEKVGLAIVSVILDNEFLKSLVNKPDLIVFIETKDGVTYSDINIDNSENSTKIKNINLKNKSFDIVNLGQKKYFISKIPLYTIREKVNNKPVERVVGTLGILYGFESLNKFVLTFQKIGLIIFAVAALFALIIAILFARNITVPILKLKDFVGMFQKNFVEIPKPDKIVDEISLLQNSFSEMSATIITKTRELEKAHEEISAAYSVMKKELIMAQHIQDAIIPKIFPESEVVSLSGMYLPMEDLGGDFYDVYQISENKIGLVVADVSGHGVPAALITMMAKVSFATNSKEGRTCSEIVKIVNQELCKVIADVENYLTVFYGILDLEKNEIEYSNAGHNDVYVIKPDGRLELLSSQTTFIGKLDFLEFPSDVVKLSVGDKIVLYTDGIPEARNSEKEFFTYERFNKLLLENRHLPAKELVELVKKEINEFQGNELPHDDMTLLIADIIGEGKKSKIELGIIHEKESIKYEKNPELDKIFIRAVERYKEGNYSEAKEIILNNLYGKYTDPENTFKVLNLLGLICYRLSLYEDAYKYWSDALILAPDNKEVNYNISIVKKILKKS